MNGVKESDCVLEQTKELLFSSRLCIDLAKESFRQSENCLIRSRFAIGRSLSLIRRADEAIGRLRGGWATAGSPLGRPR